MQVIPSINCPDRICVERRMKQVEELGASWAHLDVTDGKFSLHQTWNKKEELAEVKKTFPHIKIEAHLMVESPESVIKQWLESGADRVIVHIEGAREQGLFNELLDEYPGKISISLKPDSVFADALPFLKKVPFAQILSVIPGAAGQVPDPEMASKVKRLRAELPTITIEVDGGVDDVTAPALIAAGADILVSATYIFGSGDPQINYQNLVNS